MKILTNTILAAFCALPGLAVSGDFCAYSEEPSCCHTGYIFAYGGVFLEKNGLDGHEPRFPSTEKIDMDAGYIVGGGGGIYSDFFGGTRFEIEGLLAHNDIGRIQSDLPLIREQELGAGYINTGFLDFGFRGELRTKALMVNMFKEIPFCGFTGYVGGGIGFSQNDITLTVRGRDPLTGVTNNLETFYGSESDVALAYQFVAGVDVPVANCVDLFVQYKLLGVGETHYDRLDLVIDSHYTHNVVFGARLSF